MPESHVMVMLVAVFSVTTGVPGALGRAVGGRQGHVSGMLAVSPQGCVAFSRVTALSEPSFLWW